MGKNCLPVICMRLVWLCLQVPCMRLMSLMWPVKKITRCWWGIGQNTTTAQNDTKSWMSSVWNSQKQGEFICLRAWLVRLFVGMGKCFDPKGVFHRDVKNMWYSCCVKCMQCTCLVQIHPGLVDTQILSFFLSTASHNPLPILWLWSRLQKWIKTMQKCHTVKK